MTRPAALLNEPSPAERRVLLYLCRDKTNKEIAEILEVSPLTVKNQIQSLIRKFGCVSRVGVVREAFRRRIVDLGTLQLVERTEVVCLGR